MRGAAGFAEVEDENAKLLGAIPTDIDRALPYAQFGGQNDNQAARKSRSARWYHEHKQARNCPMSGLRLRGKGALEKRKEEGGNEGGDEKRDRSASRMERGWSGAGKREHDETGDGSDTRTGIDRVSSRDGEAKAG